MLDQQYKGNTAEATTLFVEGDAELRLGIMVDVNKNDLECDRYNAEVRLVQRITMKWPIKVIGKRKPDAAMARVILSSLH